MKIVLKKYKENVFPALLVLMIFGTLLFTRLAPLFIALLTLVWFFKFKTFQNFSLKLKWIWPFLFYFFVFGIAFFFSENTIEGLKILERHISFIVLPFLIYCKKWSKSELDFFCKFYVQIVFVISVVSLICLLYFYLTNVDFVHSMDDTYLQWKLPHLLGFHPTYFGFNIVVANIILLTSSNNNNLKNSSLYGALFLSFYLVYMSPRTAILCQFIVWIWFVYNRFSSTETPKYIKTTFAVISLSIMIFLAFKSEYFVTKLMNSISDKRFMLWEPAYDLIKENYFLLGEGLGNGEIQITQYINTNNLTQFQVSDLHNQFLMNYLDLGFFGLLAILLLVLRPLIYFKDKALYLFSLTFFISIFTESFLYVIKGIVLFIILSSIFILRASLLTVKENQK
jgi:O-antigen ligase